MEADQIKAPSISLGADPEWALYNRAPETGPVIVQYDRVLRRTEGVIGWDHSGYVQELRPRPAATVQTLVKRLRALLQVLTTDESIKPFLWTALPFLSARKGRPFVTCGGHVHVGLEAPGLQGDTKLFHSAMDHLHSAFVGAGFWDAVLVQSRSVYSKYGTPEDNLKVQRRGLPTVEYRAFPTWLHDPWAAAAILTATKVVARAPAQVCDLEPNWPGLCRWFERVAPRFAGSLPERPPRWDRDIREAWNLST